MYDLPLAIEYLDSVEFLNEVFDSVKHRVDMAFIIADHRKPDFSPLPQVVISHLCNGNIKFVFGPINKLLENLSFLLE